MESNFVTQLEFDVPPAFSTAEKCPFCEFIFPTHKDLVFHSHENHLDECSDAVKKEYSKLFQKESDELFIYHLKICSLIMLIFMALSYVYAFALVD